MPTVLDTQETAVQAQDKRYPGAPQPQPEALPPANRLPLPEHVLFSDSLLDSNSRERKRRGTATTVSFIFQCVLVAGLLIVPLMFTEALPTAQLVTMLVAPPPPPPPPPPAAAIPVVKVVQTNLLDNGQLRTPSRIPRKVEMVKEEEAPPPAFTGGVVGGVPGGVPGGQLGGVIGSIVSSNSISSAMIPKLQQPKRVRISQGVTQGLCIKKVEPAYPKIAQAAHVSGSVILKAIIGKDGLIHELQLVSGHPLLVGSAMDAVKQWRYHPYLLSGEPVEVETTVTVTFSLQS
jgi:protein TonB